MGMHDKVNHAQIIELYSKGRTAVEIEEELNCSESTVRRHLNKAGYTMENSIDKGKVIALTKAGWKPSTIAWDMHTTEEKVRQVLFEHGKGGQR